MRSSGDARSCSYTLATLLESRASAGRSISRRGVVRTGVGPPATMMRAGLHFASHYRPNAHNDVPVAPGLEPERAMTGHGVWVQDPQSRPPRGARKDVPGMDYFVDVGEAARRAA